MRFKPSTQALSLSLVFVAFCSPANAETSVEELSKQAANPLAPIISLPLSSDFSFGTGQNGKSWAYLLNIEPVIPIALSDSWNLISRTIIPVAYNRYSATDSAGGLGDINTSLFFSPVNSGLDGFVWGVGPIVLLPTATQSSLGGAKFGAGPTAVAVYQKEQWTVGALANHVWSVAGPSHRDDFSVSLIEPFLSYDLKGGRSLNFSSEASYDWNNNQWTVPLNLSVSQVFNVGSQAMNLELGGRYFAAGPEGSPKWGLRTSLTLFFPE